MQHSEKLWQLRERAIRLLSEAAPVSAVVLQVLQEMSDDDIWQYDQSQCFNSSTCERIAGVFDYPLIGVKNTITRHIIPDLEDYTPLFQSCLHEYQSSPLPEGKARTALKLSDTNQEAFLLRIVIHTWLPESKTLEEHIIEDNQIYKSCKGFLVSKQRAFNDTIELLDKVMKENWSEWQSLWAYY